MSQIGIKLHERSVKVRKMRIALGEAVDRVFQEHEPTYAEGIKLLADELSSFATYAIRIERHGTTSKKGDEADE